MRLMRDKARRSIAALPSPRQSSADTIKVVKFKSSTPECPIRIKLKLINSRTTQYTALSYTHEIDGSEIPQEGYPNDNVAYTNTSHTIQCNGALVQISTALWDALDQLRRLNSDLPIWVDQLCIDFNAREERAAQVNKMGHIYANASHVIVWLGKKTKGTDDTILCMRKLVNAIDWRRLPRNFTADFRDPTTYPKLRMDRISIPQWNNIYNFCHAKWFSRLWAFYELASAKQAMFLIGNSFMDYDFLMDFAMVLGLTGWLEGLTSMASDGYDEDAVGLTRMLGPVATLRSVPVWHPHHIDHVRWMKDEYGLDTEEERAWKFLELLLQASESFECQDPRDRIFAPLAVVRKIFVGNTINKMWPIVDYGTSAEVVFSHFAHKILVYTHEKSVIALPEIQQFQQPSAEPSANRGRTKQRRPLE